MSAQSSDKLSILQALVGRYVNDRPFAFGLQAAAGQGQTSVFLNDSGFTGLAPEAVSEVERLISGPAFSSTAGDDGDRSGGALVY